MPINPSFLVSPCFEKTYKDLQEQIKRCWRYTTRCGQESLSVFLIARYYFFLSSPPSTRNRIQIKFKMYTHSIPKTRIFEILSSFTVFLFWPLNGHLILLLTLRSSLHYYRYILLFYNILTLSKIHKHTSSVRFNYSFIPKYKISYRDSAGTTSFSSPPTDPRAAASASRIGAK